MRAGVEYTVADQARMSRARNYFAWQHRLAADELGKRVVEVGCGLGNFTEGLLEREFVVALDVERECVERLIERFRERTNLVAVTMDAAEAGFRELKRHEPDSCVCLNVLEHVQDDEAALANMAAVLPRGGRVVLIVPAFRGLYGPIDRNLGHYRRYSKEDMRRLAERAGLAVKKLRYMNTAGFFAWWVNARILRRQEQSEGQIVFFDDHIVPVLERLERIMPPPFGLSLFVVLWKA
jgi:SAM-dependent methyltransferase